MSSKLQQLLVIVKEKYDHNADPSHDFAHILRVVKNCKKIAAIEGADLEVLIPAALLHDIINVPKNHPDRHKASAMAAQEAAGILRHLGFEENQIQRVSSAVLEHSYSLGKFPTSLEAAILQDADRLDALGAVGLMRTVTCGALMGARYYSADEPIAETRNLDDKKFTLDHLYVKLFQLVDKMNTSSAKEEAKRRSEFMQAFVAQLRTEIDC